MSPAAELASRMARPQRHRLLQGHPSLPLMRRAVPAEAAHYVERTLDGALHQSKETLEPPWVQVDPARRLLVGVLPHTMCCPKVRGCGFCTFPHDDFDRRLMGHSLDSTLADIERLPPWIHGRRVAAVYFGGGTANLAREKALQRLFDALTERFDLRDAEVTLEGVPSLFLRGRWLSSGAPLHWLAGLPVRHRRVSMGIQTFDDAQRERMGRAAFGDGRTFRRVVERAHALGLGVSADLVFNLPGQTRRAMLDDVAQAAAIGLDQICFYHLVAFAGLGTAWSEDGGLLAALPDQARACDNWLALREALLAAGYVQATLTNFERRDVHATDRRFVYEELSFSPEGTDAVGVGPHAISTFIDLPRRRAVKLVRDKQPHDDGHETSLWFPYDAEDLRLLILVRSLPRLQVRREVFRRVFEDDFVLSLGAALEALSREGLVEIDDEAMRLTPRGMFFSDSVAGMLVGDRARALREHAAGARTLATLDESLRYHEWSGMG